MARSQLVQPAQEQNARRARPSGPSGPGQAGRQAAPGWQTAGSGRSLGGCEQSHRCVIFEVSKPNEQILH